MSTREHPQLSQMLSMRMLSGASFDIHDIIALSHKYGGTLTRAKDALRRMRRAGKIEFHRQGRFWVAA